MPYCFLLSAPTLALLKRAHIPFKSAHTHTHTRGNRGTLALYLPVTWVSDSHICVVSDSESCWESYSNRVCVCVCVCVYSVVWCCVFSCDFIWIWAQSSAERRRGWQFRLDGIMNWTGRPDPDTDRQINHNRASRRPHTNTHTHTHTQMAGVADKRARSPTLSRESIQDGYLMSCKCAVSQNIQLWSHCTTTQIL